MQKVIIRFTSEQAWNRDIDAEEKEREKRQHENRDYWQERERWDSWEERGYMVGCPYGMPDDRGRDMDDSFYEAEELEAEERGYRPEKELVFKRDTMPESRIAYRAELLKKYLART